MPLRFGKSAGRCDINCPTTGHRLDSSALLISEPTSPSASVHGQLSRPTVVDANERRQTPLPSLERGKSRLASNESKCRHSVSRGVSTKQTPKYLPSRARRRLDRFADTDENSVDAGVTPSKSSRPLSAGEKEFERREYFPNFARTFRLS